MFGNRSPVLGASWQPMAPTAPAGAGSRFPRLRRQAIIVGGLTLLALFTGVLATPQGWVAVGLAWAVVGFLGNARAEGRTLRTVFQYAAVAGLAVVVSAALTGSPATTHKVKTPHLKAPVNVEASQTDYLNQAKEGVTNLYEQIATGFSKPAAPPAKKEGR